MSDKIKTKISLLVASLNRQLEKEVEEKLRHMNLPIEQVRVLDALTGSADKTGMTMSELAQYAVVDASTFTKVIDRMVSDNLVYRAADSNDRRKIRILLTGRGAAVFSELRPLIDKQEVELRQIISEVSGDDALTDLVVAVLEQLGDRPQISGSSGSRG
ncbi:MarR family transcriptional regulator [Sulfitobacter sp. NFXS29]|uniref:MarR family winged helix-turn-helix transcriptional regulator n=1 Tax=Sulfitobacter sp. NFXS29 TaxID=2818438 RepID=UPI0032DF2010